MSVRALLAQRWFRLLYCTRIASQSADGVFQASLASAVFFNPDHRSDPKQVAAGFVVLLLPYSLVGPFAGVFLDRWHRQRVLVRANLVRGIFVAAAAVLLVVQGPSGGAFLIAALAAVSVNRFYLAALSAALPHVVTDAELVLANSVTTTSGTLIATAGGGVGLAVRKFAGSGDHGSAVVAIASLLLYFTAAAIAARIPLTQLGPDDPDRSPLTSQIGEVIRGLVAGARHVRERRRAGRALLAISAGRLLFGLSTIGTLLLYRNYFHNEGPLRSGLVGLGQAFAVAAVGYLAAAVVTPSAAARLGTSRWIVIAYASLAVTQLGCGLPFALPPLLVGALMLGFAASATKICVDTIVQENVDDSYRGRVFSLYDTLFNLTFVVAAVIAAFVLPANGKSYPVLAVICIGYAAIAVMYARSERAAGHGGVSVREPESATLGG
jgi:MFS family permease